ncbi:hypothetical protein MYP_4111 [Sporocytophaga myxococcoides]|uniref:Uncharacterized protein n=1 Tax=Sporocytophaga myxococcoides TaxID=153721 RepID=A0A098LIR5_9BACT|nr:hypothetical protein [Sporocytophaga myxococcoides]GAL86881.1 hypothetical protein MYP_4111 [Sporocytophaga myxococcoides]
MSDSPLGLSEYYDVYFVFALAEYLNGDKKSAFRHWLKTEEYGYGKYRYDSPISHFDSIIGKNPRNPEIYLARAISYYVRAFSIGRGEEANRYCNEALNDIRKAEESGMKDDYRINMNRALVLEAIKKK